MALNQLVGLAHHCLGFMYYSGYLVDQSYAQAVIYYRRAAAQGYRDSQYFLGFLYDEGQGVSKDPEEASKWYLMAAQNGQPDAMFAMGFRFEYGVGVTQDIVEAYKWYLLAHKRKKDLEFPKDRLEGMMTHGQVQEAINRAKSWASKRQMRANAG